MSENLDKMQTMLGKLAAKDAKDAECPVPVVADALTALKDEVAEIRAVAVPVVAAALPVVADALTKLKDDVAEIRVLASRLVEVEAQLDIERQRYALLAHTAYNAVIGMDHNGRVACTWNPAATRIFGWTPDEALGRDLADLIIPADRRARHRAGFQRVLAGGVSKILLTRLLVRALHKDGREFPVEMTIGSIKDRPQCSFLAFIHDPASLVPATPIEEVIGAK